MRNGKMWNALCLSSAMTLGSLNNLARNIDWHGNWGLAKAVTWKEVINLLDMFSIVLQVDELNTKNLSVNHSFAIYGQNRTLVVAASSPEEKLKWIEDLHSAIFLARDRDDESAVLYPSLKSTSKYRNFNWTMSSINE